MILTGRKGFAPIVRKEGGKESFFVVQVTYGTRGYDPASASPMESFLEAEEAAEKLNRKAGLDDEEAWLLIENTVMGDR